MVKRSDTNRPNIPPGTPKIPPPSGGSSVTNEVHEYYVSRAKMLDSIEPNILRLRSIMDKYEDSPGNFEETKAEIYHAALALLKMWERQQNG